MPKNATAKWDGVYQQKDRNGFVISWRDMQGRRRRRTVKVSTLQQAKDALSAERLRVEKAIQFGTPLPSKDTFEGFAAEFLKHQKRRISSNVARGRLSQAEYTRQSGIVEKYLLPFFGEMKLAAIRRSDVVRYIHSRTGKVADGSIIKEANCLKRMFNVALDLEKISINPAQRAPLPRAPEGRVRWLTNDELGRVLRSCPEWLRPIVGLLVTTGARRGELLKVRWEDVNVAGGVIRLRHTKSGKERPVFINENAAQVLASMETDTHRRGLLFPNVSPAMVTVAFVRACKSAEVTDFSLHDLRHHFASMLRQDGVDLHTLQKLLGHGDPRMTDRYSHLSQPNLVAASNRLDRILSLTPAPEEESHFQ